MCVTLAWCKHKSITSLSLQNSYSECVGVASVRRTWQTVFSQDLHSHNPVADVLIVTIQRMHGYVWWPDTSYGICHCNLLNPQIYTRDRRPPILPRVMASSAMGLSWGFVGFANYTCKNKHKTNANALRIFVRVMAFYACFTFTFIPQ